MMKIIIEFDFFSRYGWIIFDWKVVEVFVLVGFVILLFCWKGNFV